jgi:hypothetical protein
MAAWQRQPQEGNGGGHFFTGKFNYTKKIHEELSFEEIMFIYKDIKAFVQQQDGGIQYFQVYQDLDHPERRLFFIDVPDLNQCNLLFNSEFANPVKKAQLA